MEGSNLGDTEGRVAEAAAVLDRLARIEALDRDGAPASLLLDELRALVGEAERWSRAEGGDAGSRATIELRSALADVRSAAGMIAV